MVFMFSPSNNKVVPQTESTRRCLDSGSCPFHCADFIAQLADPNMCASCGHHDRAHGMTFSCIISTIFGCLFCCFIFCLSIGARQAVPTPMSSYPPGSSIPLPTYPPPPQQEQQQQPPPMQPTGTASTLTTTLAQIPMPGSPTGSVPGRGRCVCAGLCTAACRGFVSAPENPNMCQGCGHR